MGADRDGCSSRATCSTGPRARRRSRRRRRAGEGGGRKAGITLSRPVLRRPPPRDVPARWSGRTGLRVANEHELKVALPDRRPRDRDGAGGGGRGDHRLHRSGRDGACVLADGEAGARPGGGVRVVDATGAGDQFAAGFLYGVANGRDWATCGPHGLRRGRRGDQPRRSAARGGPAGAVLGGGAGLTRRPRGAQSQRTATPVTSAPSANGRATARTRASASTSP